MQLLDIFTGLNGEFIKIVLIIPIFGLLWFLSHQLHTKRRRKSYRHLSIVSLCYLGFSIVSFILLFISGVAGLEVKWLIRLIDAILNMGMLLFLYGLYRIHHKLDLKMYVWFFAPAAITLALSLISSWVGCIIGLFSVLTITYLFGKKFGRIQNVWLASGLFTLALVSTIMANFIPKITGAANMIASFAAPTAFTVLFISLMDHSLLIMQSSYVSSITDPLTGLFNRRYFTQYITKCVEQNVPVHVIFTDIDNFKKLNDTMGHKIGDEVLKKVAQIIMEEVEGLGIAGRYGGEEMVALIQNPNVDMASLTERIRRRIENETITTASIGYKIFENGLPPDVLIKHADEAMYIAKKSGKNRVVRYGASPTESFSINKGEDFKAV